MRLRKSQAEVIKLMARRGIMGDTVEQVTLALIDRGLQDVITSEYVRKHIAMLDALNERVTTGISAPRKKAK